MSETHSEEPQYASPPPQQPPQQQGAPHYDYAHPQHRGPQAPSGPPAKSPLLAAFLSVVCGLGNIYNGLYARGFVFFLLFVSLFYSAIRIGHSSHDIGLALVIPSMIFIWLFNIFDAYRQATLINWGWQEEVEMVRRQQASGTLAAGIALFTIGLYGMLEQFFDIDLTVIIDYWFVFVLGAGGWMIFKAWSQKQSEAESESY